MGIKGENRKVVIVVGVKYCFDVFYKLFLME